MSEAVEKQISVFDYQVDECVLRGLLKGRVFSLIDPRPYARERYLEQVIDSLRSSPAPEVAAYLVRLPRAIGDSASLASLRNQLVAQGLTYAGRPSAPMYPMEALEETLRATAAQQWQHAIFIFDCFENCERDFGKRLLALLTEVRCTTVGTIGLLVAGSASLYEMSVSEASPFLVADMIRLPAFGLKLVRDTLATWFANRGLVSEDEGLRAILEATGGDDVLVTMLANDLGKGVRHERITKESVLQSLDRLWGDGELREERIALVRQLISRSPRLWEDLQEILLTGHRQALVDGVDIDRLAEVPGLRCDKGKYSAAGTLNWSMLAEALQSCDPRRVARQSTNISGYTTGRRGDYMEVRLHEPDGTRPRLLVPYELFVEAGMIEKGMPFLLRTVVRDGRIVTYVDADHSQAQHIEIPPDVSAALERLEADEYGST